MTLPESWAETTIGEIAETKLGKMLDAAKNKGQPIPYLRNVNVRWGSFDLSDLLEMKVTEAEFGELAVRDGDLFLCEGGEPGRCAVWRGGRRNLVFQKAIHRVRPAEGVEPDFLARYIACVAASDGLSHLFTGTTIKHLPQVALQRIRLPLPPAAEQRRIVAKLDALAARLARARAELDRVPVLAEKVRNSVLFDAFASAATSAQIAEVASRVTKGSSPGWQGYEYQADGVLFVRSQNVRWGRLALDDRVYLPPAFNKKAQNSVIRLGDVLLNIVGASIGRAAVATEQLNGANCNQAVCVISLNDPQDAEYLALYLISPAAQAAIKDGAVDVARANFSLAQVKALKIPWPNADARTAAVIGIQRAFARADRLEAEAARARALIDRLESAILAKAFRGELVPQDPNDEPASVLLDRIRAERAAAPKAKRGRRAREAIDA